MLPVVLEKFELVPIFIAFFFSLSLSIGKRSTLAKISGVWSPRFLRAWYI